MRRFVSDVLQTLHAGECVPSRSSMRAIAEAFARRKRDVGKAVDARSSAAGGAGRGDDERDDSYSMRKVDDAWRRLFCRESPPWARCFLGWKSKRSNEIPSGEEMSFVGELAMNARGVIYARKVHQRIWRPAGLWNWRPCDLKCRVARPSIEKGRDVRERYREGFRFSNCNAISKRRTRIAGRRRFSLTEGARKEKERPFF